MHRRTTVLCVDDHPLVLEGLTALLGRQPDLEVVATATTGEEALAVFDRLNPDVTLMDLELPGIGGLEAIRRIKQRAANARIVVLTVHHANEDIERALHSGAVSYLLKDTLTRDLVRTIRDVAAGGRPIPEAVASLIADSATHPSLTAREIEVVECVSRGFANREIAVALRISEQTVHAHIKHIFDKLGVNDRTAAVRAAVTRGFIRIR